MKKATILLLLMCILCLWGCGSEPAAEDTFDPEKDGVVKLILLDNEVLSYQLIGTDGRRVETEEFESAALTALFVEANSFSTTVRDGKVCNEVVDETFFDESGTQVVPDTDALDILSLTAQRHDCPILFLTVISCGGHRFPLVELEENGKSSVILYYYNTQTKSMTKLCDLDRAAVAGMQIVNPDNLP